jgi:hypothetical protein
VAGETGVQPAGTLELRGPSWTEQEWLACANPHRMLEAVRPRPHARRLRLFACACCRHAWDLLGNRGGKDALLVAERLADGLAGEKDRVSALRLVFKVRSMAPRNSKWEFALSGVVCALGETVTDGCHHVAGAVAEHGLRSFEDEYRAQCDLVRDIFGNPFRRPVVRPAWLAWNAGCLTKMARAIYDGFRFGDLPILADALEEAGCDDAQILGHCRAGGEHARGCWVLDAILRKE